jgi:hypothetical protein
LNPVAVSCYLPRLHLTVRPDPSGPEGKGFRHGGPKEKKIAVTA